MATRAVAAVGVVALAAATAGCGSAHRPSAVATGGSSTTASSTTPVSATATTGTTLANQLPTVPNCGGGAFEPKTLLIVCGSGTTMATGVDWRSWNQSGASGLGTVHLPVHGMAASAPATLTLDEVVNGPVGPQFRRLVVTWTGMTPDGRPQDTYHLQVQG